MYVRNFAMLFAFAILATTAPAIAAPQPDGCIPGMICKVLVAQVPQPPQLPHLPAPTPDHNQGNCKNHPQGCHGHPEVQQRKH
jgi:hypothetical protein